MPIYIYNDLAYRLKQCFSTGVRGNPYGECEQSGGE